MCEVDEHNHLIQKAGSTTRLKRMPQIISDLVSYMVNTLAILDDFSFKTFLFVI